MKKSILFYFLAILTLFLFVNCFFSQKNFKSYIMPPYNTMNLILEAKTDNIDDIIVEANGTYSQIPPSKNVLNKTLHGKVQTLSFLVKKGFEKNINNIAIFNDIKVHYFKDFSSFKKNEIQICPNGKCSIYTKYTAPDSVKYNKRSDSYNFKSALNVFCSFVLSILSGQIGYFTPYIFLFITLIYFINNKNEIKKPKFNKFFIYFALFGAIIMYFNGLFDYLPWTDEYWTIEFSDPNKPFSTVFSDPGNPVLFYFIFRLFIGIFGISTVTMKIFPYLISILFIFSLAYFLKKRFSNKEVVLGLFLAAVNIPLIYYAQETRSYILQAAMTPLLSLYLFKILEENKAKNYIIYGILVGIVSNIHYYEILLVISNFIFGAIYLLFKKRHKDILKFFLANLMGGICFLPFFIYTALNKALLNPSFNSWIPNINFEQIKKCVFYIFGGGLSLLLSLIFFVYALFQKHRDKKNITSIYSFFVVAFTIILGVILSYTIRPMLVERYLVLLCPLIIIFMTSIFTSEYKNKFMPIVFLIWIILMQTGSFENGTRRKGVIEEPLSFSKQYIEKEKTSENIYSIINISSFNYLENKNAWMDDNINYISLSRLEVQKKINEILENDKNAVIFTSLLEPTKENFEKGDNYYCYFNSTTDMCLWKIKSLR